MFELFLLLGLALFALLFAKAGFMLLLVALVFLGGIALFKVGAFFFQLILIPFQIVGGLILGLLAIPLALVAIPVVIVVVLGLAAIFFCGGLALIGALIGCI
ncbi:MAG: hypothetical protein HKN20_16865 [Gemmatimonadetes bacterium]|nr:hypothetical protein [Gemmatimonadota bacterium]